MHFVGLFLTLVGFAQAQLSGGATGAIVTPKIPTFASNPRGRIPTASRPSTTPVPGGFNRPRNSNVVAASHAAQQLPEPDKSDGITRGWDKNSYSSEAQQGNGVSGMNSESALQPVQDAASNVEENSPYQAATGPWKWVVAATALNLVAIFRWLITRAVSSKSEIGDYHLTGPEYVHPTSIRNGHLQGTTLPAVFTIAPSDKPAWVETYLKVSNIVTNLFPLWTVLSAGVALTTPSAFSAITTDKFTFGLAILMFSMGITMTGDDFKRVLGQPRQENETQNDAFFS